MTSKKISQRKKQCVIKKTYNVSIKDFFIKCFLLCYLSIFFFNFINIVVFFKARKLN